MAKVRLTKIKSTIDRSKRQELNLRALGLKKINSTVEHELTPQIQGIIQRVQHLLKIEQI